MTALINGCTLCQSFRPGTDLPKRYGETKTVADNGPAPEPAFYAEVSHWRNSSLYDDRERIAIEYAERLATDPHGVAEDDEFWMRAKPQFSDPEIVELTWCIGAWMGHGRALHVLGLDAACSLS